MRYFGQLAIFRKSKMSDGRHFQFTKVYNSVVDSDSLTAWNLHAGWDLQFNVDSVWIIATGNKFLGVTWASIKSFAPNLV